jgi:hypothetical protein
MLVGRAVVAVFVLVLYVLVLMAEVGVHMRHVAMTVLVAVWFIRHYCSILAIVGGPLIQPVTLRFRSCGSKKSPPPSLNA